MCVCVCVCVCVCDEDSCSDEDEHSCSFCLHQSAGDKIVIVVNASFGSEVRNTARGPAS